jgi:hypothetical protein
MTKKNSAEEKFLKLKREIVALGWARPGSVIRRYMPCGKPSCRCMATPPQLHGPYYQWSHKVGGKTRSVRLPENQVALAQEWAENHRKFKKILNQIERLALTETDKILASMRKRAP